MNRGLARREPEDQPAAARIDRRQPEHVAEEGAVRLRVARVDDRVGADDHAASSSPMTSLTCSQPIRIRNCELRPYDFAPRMKKPGSGLVSVSGPWLCCSRQSPAPAPAPAPSSAADSFMGAAVA